MTVISDIRFNDITHGTMICEAAGAAFNPLVDQCIARVTPQGNLRGGMAYTNYTGLGGSISMHVAGFDRRWLSRDLLWVAFSYPFDQLCLKQIFGQVHARRFADLNLFLSAGFRAVTTIEDVYPDGDMILLSMYREDCRFLNIVPRSIRRGS